jgi:hypothetical protein
VGPQNGSVIAFRVVDDNWFRPLDAPIGDILDVDFEKVLTGAKRVLIFWDAHDFDLAEYVIGTLLRLVSDLEISGPRCLKRSRFSDVPPGTT